ncbi:hypothetical protein M3194_06790 [Paenibacillus glycanilyticus]|uniref:oxidoreductase n=1 Tax=Paenibacillus glycanilyticus TaxID=126569 RepID=UPI00203CC9FF|nr:hypothetical protein [Paenibacillus glycanilyticus]MCM3627067.1 hypothetical protein [Paenibacillus glycanilyticus]
MAYYNIRVKDVGMVITSATTFKEGKHYPGLPAAETDEHIPGLRKLSKVLKSHGALAILQLFHEGASGIEDNEAPSAVVADNSASPLPRELSDAEIQDLIKKFGDADAIRNIDTLADQGLDYIHVSLHDFWSTPRRGVNDKRARMEIFKDVIGNRTALIGVGGIKTPEDASKALSTGVELVAIARGLLLEPRWVKKVQEGKEDLIKTKLFRGDQSKLLLPDGVWSMIELYLPFED